MEMGSVCVRYHIRRITANGRRGVGRLHPSHEIKTHGKYRDRNAKENIEKKLARLLRRLNTPKRRARHEKDV